MPTQAMEFPLVHPDFVLPDPHGDQFISDDQIAPSFVERQLRKLRKLLKR
jgi:hypothetical protein